MKPIFRSSFAYLLVNGGNCTLHVVPTQFDPINRLVFEQVT